MVDEIAAWRIQPVAASFEICTFESATELEQVWLDLERNGLAGTAKKYRHSGHCRLTLPGGGPGRRPWCCLMPRGWRAFQGEPGIDFPESEPEAWMTGEEIDAKLERLSGGFTPGADCWPSGSPCSRFPLEPPTPVEALSAALGVLHSGATR